MFILNNENQHQLSDIDSNNNTLLIWYMHINNIVIYTGEMVNFIFKMDVINQLKNKDKLLEI